MTFEMPVIIAKAGIQLVGGSSPEVWAVDFRFGRNDSAWGCSVLSGDAAAFAFILLC